MEIKVLGTGCAKCKDLDKLVRQVVEQEKLPATVEKVEDIMEIISYGIISTPALVVDGQIVLRGYVPGIAELKKILTHQS